MDQHMLHNCFDLFFSTKQDEAAGLGLPTAHAILRRNGGYIDVESWTGRGTKIRLYLPTSPIIPVTSSSKTATTSEGPDPNLQTPGPKSTAIVDHAGQLILVAEDDGDIQTFMERCFTM